MSTATTTEKDKEADGQIDNVADDEPLFQQMTATTRQLLVDLLPNVNNKNKMPHADGLEESSDDDVQQQQQRQRRKSRLALARAITLVESTAPRKRQQANLLLQYLLQGPGPAAAPQSQHVMSGAQKTMQDRIQASFRVGITGAAGAGKSTMIEALGMYVLSHAPSSSESTNNNSNSHSQTSKSCKKEKKTIACARTMNVDECGQEDSNEENDNNDDNVDEDDDVWYPNQLAVLCIDPSSHVSGGSILGDKTRMTGLSSYSSTGTSTSHSTSDDVRKSSTTTSMIIGDRAFVRPSPSGAAAATGAAVATGAVVGAGTTPSRGPASWAKA